MLVVKVELWPGGDETRSEEIARAEIWNTSNLADTSSYAFTVGENDSKFTDHPVRTLGTITKHHRYQTVWALVSRVINKALGENK